MLADKDAAVVDELVGGFLLESLVIPGAGKGHFHRDAGANAAGAKEEGGVAGLDFGIGVRTDIAHLGFFGGDVAVFDHLIELETGSNTGEVTAFIDGGESIVEVAQTFGVGLHTGAGNKLHFRELLGGGESEGLMAEAVGDDEIAAGVNQLGGGVIAGLGLGDVRLHHDLIVGKAELSGSGFRGVDEVEVVGGVFIVQEDESNLDVFGIGSGGLGLAGGGGGLFRGLFRRGAAGAQADAQRQREQESDKLFHVFFPPVIFLVFYRNISAGKPEECKKNSGDRLTVSANERQTKQKKTALLFVDSPVIYGDRVETSKPYHLIYIDRYEIFI